MTTTTDFRPAAYLIVLLGTAAATAAAFVPQYAIGYRLDVAVLVAVLLPFVGYGMLTETLRGLNLLVPGLVLLAVCGALVAFERFVAFEGVFSGPVYWLPLLAGIVVLSAAYALRGRGQG